MDAATLHCIICPGLPSFSDVSHLLTHVASKAHLSHFFKLQVRSHQEPAAVELLNMYNDWYSTNDLAQLLSDRMTSKDERKKKRKSHASEKVDSNIQQTKRKPRRSTKPSRSVPEDFLDPRLMNSDPVKEQQDVGDILPYYEPRPISDADVNILSQAKADPVLAMHTSLGEVDNQHGHVYRQDMPTNTAIPETPQPFRNQRIPGEGYLNLGNSATYPFLDSAIRAETSDEFVDKEGADEMARLKGVLWPGMDLFDSATQQMRRKRNQKKDNEVLRKMEKSSLQIEPTELVFSPTGILRRERLIDGNADNDSPLKGEALIPKSRPLRPKRNALQRSDPNIMRAQDRKHNKGVTTRSRKTTETESYEIGAGSSVPTGSLPGLKQAQADDDDFNLSMQAFGKRPRHAFTIYTDENVITPPSLKSQSLLSKIQKDDLTLTPARLILDGASDNNVDVIKTNKVGMSKENVEPILNTRGRVDYPWVSPIARKMSAGNGSPVSQYYFDELPGVGYRPSNPLLAPALRMSPFGDNSFAHGSFASNNDWAITPTALSSEATIADDERQHHDLAIYLTGD